MDIRGYLTSLFNLRFNNVKNETKERKAYLHIVYKSFLLYFVHRNRGRRTIQSNLIKLLTSSVSQRKVPDGRPGMSYVSAPSGISGLSSESTLPSPLLFFCRVLLLFLSFFFSLPYLHILLPFFSVTICFGMAPVQRLGEVSWSVVCAACCHMTLVFAVMHLYNNFYCFCPFLFNTF